MIRQSLTLFLLAVTNNKRPILTNFLLAVGLQLVAVVLLFFLNEVYGGLYAGIQAVDAGAIWLNIGLFTAIALVLVFVEGYDKFFLNRLAFEIRVGLTRSWFGEKDKTLHHYPPNVEQRVQEDFRRFGESACDFWFAVLKAGLNIPVFVGVILTIVPWFTTLAIVVAVAVGTVITRLSALRLVAEQSVQETNEANFRRQLVPTSFEAVEKQFRVINTLFKRLAFTQAGFSQIFVLLPFIVLMPLYLAKTISMGQFFQSVNALRHIVDSLSVLIDSRQVIVNIETCLVRLKFLTETKK